MKTVSVLGATGDTGRHLVEQLQERGDKAIAIVDDSNPTRALRQTGADIVTVDLSPASVDELVLALLGSDAVVFAAGDDSVTAVEAAQIAGVRRYVHVSPPVAAGPAAAVNRVADRSLRVSDLDWTILEATARIDAAPAILAALDDERTVGHAWEIT